MAKHYKYPRTPHLPWSPGASGDDISVKSLSELDGCEVLVTEKMDGENTSLYQDHIHARSLDSRHHPSRDWVKQWHATMAHAIPQGWRVCGENLFAQHSIAYDNLSSFFYGFSIWNDNNECLSWDETLEWFDLLDVHSAPELYRGPWSEKLIRDLRVDTTQQEGYVVRNVNGFKFEDFGSNVAKWVRTGHVQTDTHWMHAELIPNGLDLTE